MSTGSCALYVFVVVLLATTYAEVVNFQSCPNSNPDAPINCTIHEVRVNPCREAAQNKPCRLKKGRDASIEFDFTPKFGGSNIEGRVYWTNQMIDLPFIGMDSNACNATTCPVVTDQKQSYSVTLPISKQYPARTFDVKWKLIEAGKEDAGCCFIFQIRLHK